MIRLMTMNFSNNVCLTIKLIKFCFEKIKVLSKHFEFIYNAFLNVCIKFFLLDILFQLWIFHCKTIDFLSLL